MRRILFVIVALGMVNVGRVSSLSAQAPHARTHAQTPRTDPRIPAPSDTGRALTGYQTYARYDAPSQCSNAVEFLSTDLRAWSGLWYDTLAYTARLSEHQPTAVIDEARRCAGRFTAATVAPRELSFLLPLTIVMGDSVQTRAVIDRELALAPDEADKAAVLLTAMQSFLNARPIQMASAEAILARFDTVAPTRRLEHVKGHELLLDIARVQFDLAWMRREIATMRSLMQPLSVEQRGELPGFYGGIRDLWLWEYGADSTTKAMAVLLKELPYLLSAAVFQRNGTAGLNMLAGAYVRPVGQTAPPLPGSFWMPAPGVTPYPKPGQMTLVMSFWKREKDGDPITTTVAQQLRPLRAMLTRLHEKYGSHGLQILFVLQPAGFTPPTSEADRFALTAKWFTAQFPFPVVVGEQALPFTTRPLPDGRRIYGKDAIDTDPIYKSLKNWPVKLVGPDGKFVGSPLVTLPEHEAELEAFIRQGLNLPPVSSN